jgi:cyclopropane fatty-acyl-phospholipid synthase-like methyltransferase
MTLDAQTLIDLALDFNMAPSTWFTQWHELGDWQFDILKRFGLKPQHRLLDVGCGPLRLGSLAIPYLEPGHYYGIDPNGPLLALGRAVLDRLGIDRAYTLLQSGSFEFDRFGAPFDFAIAQSVITHLSRAQITSCFTVLKSVMQPGSTFIFTYLLSSDAPPLGFLMDGVEPMIRPGLADEAIFVELAERLGFRFVASDEPHPSQKVAICTF